MFEEFLCAICYETMRETKMTPCGHIFCGDCITECLDRQAKCPACNASVTARDVVANKHADRLLALLVRQKDEASKRYFERLVNRGSAAADADDLTASQQMRAAERNELLSPVESLFHQHMKQSLGVFESFLTDVNARCASAAADTKQRYVAKMEDARKSVRDPVALNERIASLVARCDAACAKIERGRAESQKLVLEQFAAHLQRCGTAPERLPCVVRIRLADWAAADAVRATLKPADAAGAAIRAAFETRQRERADPVVSWGDNVQFEMVTITGKKVALDDDVALGARGLESDAEIVIRGAVVLESNKPQLCFATTFKEGDAMDYKQCQECRLNWICKSCAEVCHKGHTLSPFLEQHKPTWGCCYCKKKGKNCKLVK